MSDHADWSGVAPLPIISSRSLPTLPYNSLSWHNFELFVAELIDRLPDFESVQNFGAFPDNQQGVDITARNGEDRWAFQCKRVSRFGPADFRIAAQKAAEFTADTFVIVLSSRATVNLIEAATAAHWEVWDSDFLDRKVRSLDAAFSLVDAHFGRAIAKAFLGVKRPGIFLTTEEFFAPYVKPGRVEDLATPLVDRTEELKSLKAFITNPGSRVLLLAGPSGVGKTKLLYELAHAFAGVAESIRFAREAADLDDAALDELSTGVSLLVVDDVRSASRIEELASAMLRSSDKLLFSMRSSDDAQVQERLLALGYDSESISRIKVGPLSSAAAAELVRQAAIDDIEPSLPMISKLSSGVPLVIQVITFLIREGQRDLLPALSTEQYPVAVLFQRYADVLAGKVSETQSCPKADVLSVLRLMSAVGPRDIRTAEFKDAATRFLDWDSMRLAATVKALEDSDVLVRTGSRTKIIPELLGLYILRDACSMGSIATEFAEEIIRQFGYDRQVLLNLAIVSDMDDGARGALRPVWAYLREQIETATSFQRLMILDEVDDLGYLLPDFMLDIVEFVISHPARIDAEEDLSLPARFGQADVLRKLPRIVRSIARSGIQYLPRSVEILWKLGRDEERHFGFQNAFEVLIDLASYERYKPISFIVAVLQEIEKINQLPQEQCYRHLPLAIAVPVLARSYDSSESRGATLVLQRRAPKPSAVEPARSKAIDIMAVSLTGPVPRAQSEAAEHLAAALLGPPADSDEDREIQRREHDRILDLFQTVRDDPAPELLHARIATLLSWHAQLNSAENVRARALNIIAGLEGSVAFDWYAALIPDIARHMPSVSVRTEYDQLQASIDSLLDRVVDRILSSSLGASDLVERISRTLREAQAYGLHGGPGWLFITLSGRDLKLSKSVADTVIDNPSEIGDTIAPIIHAAWNNDRAWVDRAVARALSSGDQKLLISVASALWQLRAGGNDEADRRAPILATLLERGNKEVREVALRAIGTLLSIDRSRGIALILSLDLGEDTQTADELFANLRDVQPQELGEHGIARMLDYLTRVEQLDYWASEFLRQLATNGWSRQVLDLLMRRIERSADTPSGIGGFRPVPYGQAIVPHEVELFDNLNCTVEDLEGALRRGFHLSDRSRFWFTELVSNLARRPLPLFEAFARWLADADAPRVEFLAESMRRIPADAVFAHADFVIALLERSGLLGESTRQRVLSSLSSSVTTGLRQGVAFEAMPQDVSMIERAQAIRDTLRPGSTAFEFFDEVVRYGQESVRKKLETDIDTFGEPE